MEDKDYAVSEQMVSSLCNFARTCDPNSDCDFHNWKASASQEKKVMMTDEDETRIAKPSLLKMIKTMLINKAVGE